MRVFKIKCPECEAPAIIRKSEWKDKKVADLYCACSDVECGHTFVQCDLFPFIKPQRADR